VGTQTEFEKARRFSSRLFHVLGKAEMHVAQNWIRFWVNDVHHNKRLTRFRRPQNFLLPMTLK